MRKAIPTFLCISFNLNVVHLIHTLWLIYFCLIVLVGFSKLKAQETLTIMHLNIDKAPHCPFMSKNIPALWKMRPNLCIYGTLAPFVHSGGFKTLRGIWGACRVVSIQSLWAHQLKWKWCCGWESGRRQVQHKHLVYARPLLAHPWRKKKKKKVLFGRKLWWAPGQILRLAGQAARMLRLPGDWPCGKVARRWQAAQTAV